MKDKIRVQHFYPASKEQKTEGEDPVFIFIRPGELSHVLAPTDGHTQQLLAPLTVTTSSCWPH
ncbi:hypothetical protein Hamer_G017172 [Homarus americanus]|uniref:Uncharacterized protein n=1 Tax=Homarus americanus TaxID=6706 RepID=A0A8J5K0A0_HOMAM|nr:hypothetical protein Hamer_G017172 [Homarus americanus]